MTKRYLAFLGDIQRPKDKENDMIGSYDDIDDAKYAIHCKVREDYCSLHHHSLALYLTPKWEFVKWAHIFDTKLKKIVWEK